MEDKCINEILVTKDYSKFKFIKSNRKINQRNYAKLYRSMQKKQLRIPIMVNSNFEILDGQHRFTVSKDLNLPIYYYVEPDYGVDEMKQANQVNSSWTKQDFLNSFAASGDERYEKILQLCDDYNINVSAFIKALAKFQHKNVKVISLEFEQGLIDIEKIDLVENFLMALEDFAEFRPYKTIQFFSAFLSIYTRKNYDHNQMVYKLETRFSSLVKRNTIDDYILVLTRDIYNFGKVKRTINYDAVNKQFY